MRTINFSMLNNVLHVKGKICISFHIILDLVCAESCQKGSTLVNTSAYRSKHDHGGDEFYGADAQWISQARRHVSRTHCVPRVAR